MPTPKLTKTLRRLEGSRAFPPVPERFDSPRLFQPDAFIKALAEAWPHPRK